VEIIVPVHAMEWCHSAILSQSRRQMEMSGYPLAPAALPPLKILRNPLNRRLGKFQRQSGKENILLSCRVSDYDSPVFQPVAQRCIEYAFLAPPCEIQIQGR
jgi:hypothetical protein